MTNTVMSIHISKNCSLTKKNTNRPPAWADDTYRKEYASFNDSKYKCIKGSRKFRKEQDKKKRRKRSAEMIRVYSLIDEPTVMER